MHSLDSNLGSDTIKYSLQFRDFLIHRYLQYVKVSKVNFNIMWTPANSIGASVSNFHYAKY